MMSNQLVFLFLTIICVSVLIVNAQESTFGLKQNLGQTFEEVIVSSDLNVRRKSKENRGGKKLLTNIPLATTSKTTQTANNNPIVSRLISDDGSRVVQEKRNRRYINPKYRLDLGTAEYLLHSRN